MAQGEAEALTAVVARVAQVAVVPVAQAVQVAEVPAGPEAVLGAAPAEAPVAAASLTAYWKKSATSVPTYPGLAPVVVAEEAVAVHPRALNRLHTFPNPNSRPSTYQHQPFMPGPKTGQSSANLQPFGPTQTSATST